MRDVVALADAVAEFIRDGDWQDKVPEDLVDQLEEALERPLLARLCEFAGHQPVRDQCGNPAHDYCRRCHEETPGQAGRPGSTTAVLPPSEIGAVEQ